jgi:hypothetical protein
MNGGCRRTVVGYWSWRDSTMAARQLRIADPFRCCPRRECAGRNANERRASLEKDDVQADLMILSGKADKGGRNERNNPPCPLHGVVDSMYTRKTRNTGGPFTGS